MSFIIEGDGSACSLIYGVIRRVYEFWAPGPSVRQNLIYFPDLFRSRVIKRSITCRYDSKTEEDGEVAAGFAVKSINSFDYVA